MSHRLHKTQGPENAKPRGPYSIGFPYPKTSFLHLIFCGACSSISR